MFCHPLRLKLYQVPAVLCFVILLLLPFQNVGQKILIDAFTTFSTGLFCSKMVGTLSYTGDAGTSDLLRSRCGVLIVRSVLKGIT